MLERATRRPSQECLTQLSPRGGAARQGFRALRPPLLIGGTHDAESRPNDTRSGETDKSMLSRNPDQFTAVLNPEFAMQLASHSGDGGGAELQGARRDGIITAVADDGQDDLFENREEPE